MVARSLVQDAGGLGHGVALISFREARLYPAIDQPAGHMAGAVDQPGDKFVWLKAEAFFGSIGDGLGRVSLLGKVRRRRFNIGDYHAIGIDQLVEPVEDSAVVKESVFGSHFAWQSNIANGLWPQAPPHSSNLTRVSSASER